MRQRWSDLLFLHWPVAPSALRAAVPAALDIDTFDGRAWLAVVPFTVSGARHRLLPAVPFLSGFHEVNVRTYVHHGGRRPGVWFFSLDASNAIVAQVARLWYKLPYRHARIDLAVEQESPPPPVPPARWVRFSCRRSPGGRPDLQVRYRGGDLARPAEPGTLEHFLVERYDLYAGGEEGLYTARVQHEPYPLQPAVVQELREGLIAGHGLSRPEGEPLAHYAAGVDVEVFGLEEAT